MVCLTFEEAIHILKNNRHLSIRRNMWDDGLYLEFFLGDDGKSEELKLSLNTLCAHPWIPDVQDLVANDWYVENRGEV